MTGLASVGLVLLAAYLVGAIPFGYVVARVQGINIFEHGSGNIGATNVGRVLGRGYGVLVFLLDLSKGTLPAALASWLSPHLDVSLPRDSLPVGTGLAAFLGHLFPIYLGFRGGKGVATGAGVVLVLLTEPALGAMLVWLAVLLGWRYVSLASACAAASLPLFHMARTANPFDADHVVLTSFCLVAAVLVLVRHQSNLLRLVRGTENRLRDTPAMHTLTKTVHVLALGLWFGMAIFFSFIVAFSLFGTFEALAERPAAERPIWFPLPTAFDQEPATRKEQGTRAAGAAISPLFDAYFSLQGACGLLAVVTALQWSWAEPGNRVHRFRMVVLLLAQVTVLAGWPIERKVSELRHERLQTADAVLLNKEPPESVRAAAAAMRAEFGRWHGYSTLINLATILLVTIGMALTARLPPDVVAQPRRPEDSSQEAANQLAPSVSEGPPLAGARG